MMETQFLFNSSRTELFSEPVLYYNAGCYEIPGLD